MEHAPVVSSAHPPVAQADWSERDCNFYPTVTYRSIGIDGQKQFKQKRKINHRSPSKTNVFSAASHRLRRKGSECGGFWSEQIPGWNDRKIGFLCFHYDITEACETRRMSLLSFKRRMKEEIVTMYACMYAPTDLLLCIDGVCCFTKRVNK